MHESGGQLTCCENAVIQQSVGVSEKSPDSTVVAKQEVNILSSEQGSTQSGELSLQLLPASTVEVKRELAVAADIRMPAKTVLPPDENLSILQSCGRPDQLCLVEQAASRIIVKQEPNTGPSDKRASSPLPLSASIVKREACELVALPAPSAVVVKRELDATSNQIRTPTILPCGNVLKKEFQIRSNLPGQQDNEPTSRPEEIEPKEVKAEPHNLPTVTPIACMEGSGQHRAEVRRQLPQALVNSEDVPTNMELAIADVVVDKTNLFPPGLTPWLQPVEEDEDEDLPLAAMIPPNQQHHKNLSGAEAHPQYNESRGTGDTTEDLRIQKGPLDGGGETGAAAATGNIQITSEEKMWEKLWQQSNFQDEIQIDRNCAPAQLCRNRDGGGRNRDGEGRRCRTGRRGRGSGGFQKRRHGRDCRGHLGPESLESNLKSFYENSVERQCLTRNSADSKAPQARRAPIRECRKRMPPVEVHKLIAPTLAMEEQKVLDMKKSGKRSRPSIVSKAAAVRAMYSKIDSAGKLPFSQLTPPAPTNRATVQTMLDDMRRILSQLLEREEHLKSKLASLRNAKLAPLQSSETS